MVVNLIIMVVGLAAFIGSMLLESRAGTPAGEPSGNVLAVRMVGLLATTFGLSGALILTAANSVTY